LQTTPALAECPHCGQRVLVRYGVRLSPKLADIFDAIELGISKKELAYMFYGNGGAAAIRSLVTSVNHINRAFEWMESPVRVRSSGHNLPYQVLGKPTLDKLARPLY
jgi:hypothetical protein